VKDPLWSAIYDLFMDVDGFLTHGEIKALAAGSAAGTLKAAAPAAARVMSKTNVAIVGMRAAFDAGADLVQVRAALRARLDVLKASLSSSLTERETYLVLFPLVVFCDEMVKNKYPEQASKWPPLQKELFRIDNGGEAFYETLDDLLRKPETIPFVYEVYYLCISYGFRGRYADNLAKINEYKAKLEPKIPLATVERKEAAKGADVVRPPRAGALAYYAAAAAFIGCSWAALYAIASF
jgi:type IV/VI secretion system ImpK/VasF family protein